MNTTLKWNQTKSNIYACEYKGNKLETAVEFKLRSKVSCAKETEYYLSVFATETSNVKLYIFR